MWEQTDCIDYLRTSAVLAAYSRSEFQVLTHSSPGNILKMVSNLGTSIAK
jgi:hypothetical protein